MPIYLFQMAIIILAVLLFLAAMLFILMNWYYRTVWVLSLEDLMKHQILVERSTTLNPVLLLVMFNAKPGIWGSIIRSEVLVSCFNRHKRKLKAIVAGSTGKLPGMSHRSDWRKLSLILTRFEVQQSWLCVCCHGKRVFGICRKSGVDGYSGYAQHKQVHIWRVSEQYNGVVDMSLYVYVLTELQTAKIITRDKTYS